MEPAEDPQSSDSDQPQDDFEQDTQLEVLVYAPLVMGAPNRRDWILRRHLIVPAGTSKLPSSASCEFAIIRLEGTDPQVYQIVITALYDSGRPSAPCFSFPAAYLRMEQLTPAECGVMGKAAAKADFDIPAAKVFELQPPADDTQHRLMITGQLTGCTVCWRRKGDDGTLLITHLQPSGGLTGEQLHTSVQDHGLLEGQRVAAAVGRNKYTGTAHLFGVWVPAANKWRFFVQQRLLTYEHAVQVEPFEVLYDQPAAECTLL